MNNMKEDILNWFCTGEVGASSTAMAIKFAGINSIESIEKSHPYDPDDLNRCLLFLKAVPEARHRMNELRELSIEWNNLITSWVMLEKMFIDEVGLNWSKGGKAEKTYKLMCIILDR